MSARDFKVVKNPGGTRVAKVDDRTTSGFSATFKEGEMLIKGGSGGNFAVYITNGAPVINSEEVLGISKKESSETSSAEGTVELVTIIPNLTVIRGKANTAANVNTAAKLQGLLQDWVAADESSNTVTIDEDETDDPNTHGLCIVDGDTVYGTLDVVVHAGACQAGPLKGQTLD